MENKLGGTFMAHTGKTEVVPYEVLATIAPPETTRWWKPVSHKSVVDTIRNAASDLGMEIVREQFAVSANGAKLFGLVNFSGEIMEGVGRCMAFRHGNDKSMVLHFVAGANPFVCDNMALSGDYTVFKHKHTWGFSLFDQITRGLVRYEQDMERFKVQLEGMAATAIDDRHAKAFIADRLYDGTVTHQIFNQTYDFYFEKGLNQPEIFSDCAPRTLWGLHNAFTRGLKIAAPNIAMKSTMELTKKLVGSIAA